MHKTCSKIDIPIVLPKGVPSFLTNESDLWLPKYNISSTLQWMLKTYDWFCVIHTPGFDADNTMFGLEENYQLNEEPFGSVS